MLEREEDTKKAKEKPARRIEYWRAVFVSLQHRTRRFLHVNSHYLQGFLSHTMHRVVCFPIFI